MFGSASSISYFGPTSQAKLDARIRLTEAVIRHPQCPVLKHIVFRAAGAGLTGWLFIRTGSNADQLAWSAFCATSHYNDIFRRLFGESPPSIIWHDNQTADWAPPGQEITSRGRSLFVETMQQIEKGEYALEYVL